MQPEPPASIAEALASGETHRAHRVIDLVDAMSVEERAAVFDAYFDVARSVYESDDGYVRQSAIRFASSLHPRPAPRAVGRTDTAEPVPVEFTLTDATRHRQRLADLFSTALADDDGRVRRAAVKGIKTVAVAADVIDERAELQSMLADLESVAAAADKEAQAHVEDALDQVSFYLDGSPSLLPASVLERLADRGGRDP
jgi:hypothetical protein